MRGAGRSGFEGQDVQDDTSDIATMSEAVAREELARLSDALSAADAAYHQKDAPVISDDE
jgi:hypothetical protein